MSMPHLQAPEWLLLFPALVFVAWYFRAPRLDKPLRFLVLASFIVVLAEPVLPEGGGGLDVWVLVDRSASAQELLEPNLEEMEGLLERSRPRSDGLFFVDFAETAQRRISAEEQALNGATEATALATAAHFALSSMDPDRSARILALTDGFSTEPLDDVEDRLHRQQVPLDLRILARTTLEDRAIKELVAPHRVQPGEPFELEVHVSGEPDGAVPLTLWRDGEPVARAVAKLHDGSARLRFSDRLTSGGATRFEARLDIGEGPDAYPGNDSASTWVDVQGGARLLVVTAYANDPMVSVLRRQGFEVEVVTEPQKLHMGRLSGSRAVLLNNVPAYQLPNDFITGLEHYVRVQGRGLLMAGGAFSFGSGGYFDSPIDPLLPVSMELRQDHRMLSVAMAIVMDRSGSMAAGVAGGRSKMDLANEGAARSIELLGSRDAVAVFAVDSAAHEMVPLTPLDAGSAEIVDKVRRITSSGGGIYVYEGLQAAWNVLRDAPHGQKHIILFSDAADSEQPGQYQDLLDEIVRGGGTVSVIGLGTDSDSDAALLKDIASLGGGRIFFNADATTLPAIFAQETVAVARSAFIEETVAVQATAGWREVSDGPLSGLNAVDGYNLSYLREGATGAAFTRDEYEAPLVSFWNRGGGRVAAVAFPLGGDFSQSVRGWSEYGDFLQTLSRWLMGDELPPGIGLGTRLDGTTLQMELLFDETWEPRFAEDPPEILMAPSGSGSVQSLVWERLEPGRFRASHALKRNNVYRGAVRVGEARLPFGPIAAPSGVEWDFDPQRVAALRAISRSSGGVERAELASIWDEASRAGDLDLRPLLLACCLALFLFEVLWTRAGWAWPRLQWMRAIAAAWSRAKSAAPQEAVTSFAEKVAPEAAAAQPGEPATETAIPATDPAAVAVSKRRARFQRAKRGR